jgi:hypothetical protein
MKQNLTRAACLAILLAGCSTLNTPDIPRIALAVREAARVGTSEALRDHPEWIPKFKLARDQLNMLATRGTLTATVMLDSIAELPVSMLSSDAARLSFEGARIIVAVAGWSSVEIVQTQQIRPVVEALAAGITDGLPVNPVVLSVGARRLVKPGKHYKAR